MLRLQSRIRELESRGTQRESNGEIWKNSIDAEESHATHRLDPGDGFVEGSQSAEPERRAGPQFHDNSTATPNLTTFTPQSLGYSRSDGDGPFSESASGMIGSLADNDQSREFYGGSSAANFISQMRSAVQRKLGVSDPAILAGRANSSPHFLSAASTQRQKPFEYVLPGRRRADRLLSIYWELVYPIYPFIDKREFATQYESLWASQENEEDDQVFLCAVNLIFALSSQLDEELEPSKRQASADVYFERAKDFLDIWRMNSLPSVQVFLLLSLYLQSTNAPDNCWMVTGVAIRTAQSLGLHLRETSARVASPRERELARKVWHACILMDRFVAMSYGRPSMINTRIGITVPMPLAIDEEHLPTEDTAAIPNTDQPSMIDFFVQSLRLYEILDEVLAVFYSSHLEKWHSIEQAMETFLGHAAVSNGSSILDIDRKLVQWDKNLPPHLQFEHTSTDLDTSRIFNRQAVILRQRSVLANFSS